ncbi:MAG TPA: NADH-quinone oxidoreductase subunit C [Bryobacteraceae bacterium]|nr:NADH-quinone oxidoreductase subunit C [Bryobacteraceae bacterium]
MIADHVKERPVVASLIERHPNAILDGALERGETSLFVEPSQIVALCAFLKHDERFNRLSGITAVDWYPVDPRFEVVYLLHSLSRGERLRLKCRLSGQNAEIDSVTGVWRAADWYEREVFDLFGIRFRNHPNLTRIMMPDTWEGHPLRRDYPVHGHKYDYSGDEIR